jgi:hypothetical protein
MTWVRSMKLDARGICFLSRSAEIVKFYQPSPFPVNEGEMVHSLDPSSGVAPVERFQCRASGTRDLDRIFASSTLHS